MKRIGSFLIAVAMVVGMVGCGDGNGEVSYQLTVSSTSGGSVIEPDEGVHSYEEGTVVDLVAEPDAGYRFVNWTGDVGSLANVNAASTTVTMNDDYSITANFDEIEEETPVVEYDLTIESTEGGEVTAPGEGTFTCDAGTVVDLVAVPDAGHQFVAWTGDVGTIGNVNSASTSITVNGDYSITANFSETAVTLYTLTIAVSGSGSTSPAVGQHTYAEGTVVPISASAATGWQFANWTGDTGTMGNANAAETTITMNGDYSITANFAIRTHDLTTGSTAGGSVTTPGEDTYTYEYGTVVNLVATPDTGYQFAAWTGDVGTVADVNSASTTITMNGDYSVVADFTEIVEYELTISSTAGGSVTTPGEGTFIYDEGAAVDLVATADKGYEFVNWTGDVGTVADVNAASTTITMNGDCSITANFEEIVRYDLTILGSVGGSVIEPGEGVFVYTEGTIVSLVAEAALGYGFSEWTGDVGTVGDVGSESTTILMDGHLSVSPQFEELGPDELFAGGTGTKEDPYQLTDWYHLNHVRLFLSAHYRLNNDLDLGTDGYAELAGPAANGGMGWEPIGDYEVGSNLGFTGSLDGQGHQISDLFINRFDQTWVGLFDVIKRNGVIENARLVNFSVTGGSSVGSLAGASLGTIRCCYSDGSVSGDSDAGGLVGRNGGTVSNSYMTGTVSGNECVGGLVAVHSIGAVSNSHSTASVSAERRAGGLVGLIYGGGTVSNCYATGTVSGGEHTGGLVGTIYDGTVSNCYSVGSVSASPFGTWIGGLVGANWGTVSNCFWDIEKSGQTESGGGTGKSTAEMMDIATFADVETEGLDEPWDIVAVASGETNPSHIWNIVDGQTYPFPGWQQVP